MLDFINEKLFETLKNLSFDENSDPRGFVVRDVFEDSYNYMKNGTLIHQVINKINEIDFTNYRILQESIFGIEKKQLLRLLCITNIDGSLRQTRSSPPEKTGVTEQA